MIKRRKKQEGDPLISGLIAYGTDSAIAGAILGGSVGGAIIGDILNGDNSSYDILDDLFD